MLPPSRSTPLLHTAGHSAGSVSDPQPEATNARPWDAPSVLFAAANTAACARNAGRQPLDVSVRAYSSSVNTFAPSPSASPTQVGVKLLRSDVHGALQLVGVTPFPEAEQAPPERTEALWGWSGVRSHPTTGHSTAGRTSDVRVALQPADSVAAALELRSKRLAAATQEGVRRSISPHDARLGLARCAVCVTVPSSEMRAKDTSGGCFWEGCQPGIHRVAPDRHLLH
jgi:hypothetical protein